MTEADFALIGLMLIPIFFCAIGILVVFPWQVERAIDWLNRKRSTRATGDGGRSPA